MSTNPVLLVIYVLLVFFIGVEVRLFYLSARASVLDRQRRPATFGPHERLRRSLETLHHYSHNLTEEGAASPRLEARFHEHVDRCLRLLRCIPDDTPDTHPTTERT